MADKESRKALITHLVDLDETYVLKAVRRLLDEGQDPLAIIEDIRPGLDPNKEIAIEPDRQKAIELALSMCRENDLLIVAGKGHENYQILGERRIHFDDREIIENYLRERYS